MLFPRRPTFELTTCRVRPWEAGDIDALVRHANDPNVSENLRDRFPYPYGPEDARTYLQAALAEVPVLNFAIIVDGEAAGGIGLVLHEDIERTSAEVGYWLGRGHWGKGIMTEALRAVTEYAITELGMSRVFAVAFVRNVASARVLAKAGFTCEGRMRRSVIKHGEILDQYLYAFTDLDLARGDAVHG